MILRWLKIVLLIQVLLFALSCSNRGGTSATVDVEEKWSCFNGCSIFLSDGKYGLMDEDGDIIFPSQYDSIEFLDNDIARLREGDQAYLCNRKGRIICNDNSPDSLRINYSAIVEQVYDSDRQSWEDVINSYSNLCNACKKNQGHRLNRSQYHALKKLFKDVKNHLNEASGCPTLSQKARLEALSDDYRRAF